jgi:hypothetical protein
MLERMGQSTTAPDAPGSQRGWAHPLRRRLLTREALGAAGASRRLDLTYGNAYHLSSTVALVRGRQP